MKRRRRILLAAAAGILAARLPAFAQQPPFRLAWFGSATMAEGQALLDALLQGLRELGYVQGRNLFVDARWGGHATPQAQAQIAAEIVAAHPQLIVTLGPSAFAVHTATRTIPVVFGFSGDPVLAGFAESYARPGGNFTGMSFLALDLVGKRIELLKAMLPGARRIAVVANAQHPGDQAERRASEAAAAASGLVIEYFEAASSAELEAALLAIQKSRSQAVLMFPIQSIISNSARIAAWSMKTRIPAVSGWSQFAEQGNLMSYGANLDEAFRRIAVFVDRIFKGASPAQLPVELPLRFELVVNLKAARALGVTVPQSVLLRTDRLIE